MALLLPMYYSVHAQIAEVVPEIGAVTGQEPVTPVPPAPPSDPRIVSLGEKLFNDRRLSGNGTRSCSSCHDVHTNGADGNQFDATPNGGRTTFHTITVFNAALSYRLDWEGNAQTLEEQAALSLRDPQLMATSVRRAAREAGEEGSLAREFGIIYGHAPCSSDLLNAIATYERSLVTPGARFDLWLEGDRSALSLNEQVGYKLFKSFGCISCHQGVELGGNLFERSGIFHPLGGYQGQMLLVPSLRNVAVMAPYFHNGSVASLDEAVAEMGYAQLDRRLSDQQIKAVSAFLSTLTGSYDGKEIRSANGSNGQSP
ncbi:cytochrome-c peroxidase [Acidisoma sp.]|uniref:cytochrome-c peroxidase n=1 Tax=Acidisoma sp. TaxID=1872115 RepID=UPI003B00A471